MIFEEVQGFLPSIHEERRALLEVLTGIKRAGADLILTYSAVDAARSLSDLA